MDLNAKQYPKVLIVGQTFSGVSGASITLRNLFHDWPKDNMAVATYNIDETDVEAFNHCENYYRLGKGEVKSLLIINRFLKIQSSKIISRPTVVNENHRSSVIIKKKRYLQKYLYHLIKIVLVKTGLNSLRIQYSLSTAITEWIREYDPQIIYSALGDIDLIRLVLQIKNITNSSLVIHIWDDWPNTLHMNTIFPNYWKKRFDKEFRNIINEANICLSISRAMSDEYGVKYGRIFYPFHNPVSLSIWDDNNRIYEDIPQKYILYAGKINSDTINTLLLMAKVVDEINKQVNYKIFFHIYSTGTKKQSHIFSRYHYTILHDTIPHKDIIAKIKGAYILFLPIGFNKKSIAYVKLSMPTKATEYMISGVPTIVMAHPETALNIHAKINQWALTVDDQNFYKLKLTVMQLINDDSTRIRITSNALAIAKEYHDADKVRNDFVNILSKGINNYGNK